MSEVLDLVWDLIKDPPVGEHYIEMPVNYGGQKRTLKVVGYRSLVSVNTPEDPIGKELAYHISNYIAETLCGPQISGVKLVADQRPMCSFVTPTTDRCVYNCAPILEIRDRDGLPMISMPPCHGKESPSCVKYAGATEVCITLKARACETTSVNNKPAFATAFSFLDTTVASYEIAQYVLKADDKSLAYVTFSTPRTKTRDDIIYGYLRLDFEYDYT
jgi:hypothetical protein